MSRRRRPAPPKPQVTLDGFAYRQRFSENYIFPPPYGGGTFWEGRLGLQPQLAPRFLGTSDGTGRTVRTRRRRRSARRGRRRTDAVELGRAGIPRIRTGTAPRAGRPAGAGTARGIARPDHATCRARGSIRRPSCARPKATSSRAPSTSSRHDWPRLARNALAALTGTSATSAPALATPTLDFDAGAASPPACRWTCWHGGRTCAPRNCVSTLRPRAAKPRTRISIRTSTSSRTRDVGHRPRRNAARRLAHVGRRPRAPPAHFRRRPAQGRIPPLRRRTRRGRRGLQRVGLARGAGSLADQSAPPALLELQLAAQQRVAGRRRAGLRPGESQRYSGGLATQVTVLNAETQVLAARRQRTQLLADRTSARIALLVALGGHFTQEPAR